MKLGNSWEDTAVEQVMVEKSGGKWSGPECILEIKLAGLRGGFYVERDRKKGAKDSSQVVFGSTTGQMILSTEMEDTGEE